MREAFAKLVLTVAARCHVSKYSWLKIARRQLNKTCAEFQNTLLSRKELINWFIIMRLDFEDELFFDGQPEGAKCQRYSNGSEDEVFSRDT